MRRPVVRRGCAWMRHARRLRRSAVRRRRVRQPGLGARVLQPRLGARVRQPRLGTRVVEPGVRRAGVVRCRRAWVRRAAVGRQERAGVLRTGPGAVRRGLRRPALRPLGLPAAGAHLLRDGRVARRSPDRAVRAGRLYRRPARPLQHRLPRARLLRRWDRLRRREHGCTQRDGPRVERLRLALLPPVTGVDAERAPGGEVLHPTEEEHAEHRQPAPTVTRTSVRVSVPSPRRATTSGTAATAIGNSR